MLVNGVSLFNNRFKSYPNTNVNKEYISFDASPKEIDSATDGIKRVIGTVEERVRSGNISEHTKGLRKALEDARKNGELESDGREERLPGMPESD